MNPNTQNLMAPSYLKVNKHTTAGNEEDVGEEEEEEEEGGSDVGMRFVLPSQLKRKKTSLGQGSGRSTGSGGACCLVESCRKNLSGCKSYYLRHRVCEVHAKAPVVFVDALRQRFCQQCSRFHELTEFDEMKRSCRRRLAGHNERRRKSSLEPNTRGKPLQTP